MGSVTVASIPTEDNYVDWVLTGIRDYFRKLDYRVRTYSLGQVVERQCPVDRVLEVGSKVVGLQFKRPLTQGPPWRYKLLVHQHAAILASSWIYYCLPSFTDYEMQEVALFHCLFARGSALSPTGTIEKGKYPSRWGAFANSILACRTGQVIRSEETALDVVTQLANRPTVALLALDLTQRTLTVAQPETHRDDAEVDGADGQRLSKG